MKNREDLIREIEDHMPINRQEAMDKEVLLSALREQADIFLRTNITQHMTASAWVVNKERTKVLMCYHRIYDSWSWLGGHADGDEDLLHVAIKEVKEESGLDAVPVDGKILSLEVLCVNGHEKHGEYVSSHLHLNVTYLLEADELQLLQSKPDENAGVRWMGWQEAIDASNEPWFKKRIYGKIKEKTGH